MEIDIKFFGNTIQEHCFACLSKTEYMEDVASNAAILYNFKITFGLEIKINDRASNYLCNVCNDKLERATEFYQQIQNSMKHFSEYKEAQNLPNVKLEETPKETTEPQVNYDDFYHYNNDDNDSTDQAEVGDSSDSDNEPLINLTRKKIPFNAKLKKIPLKVIEEALNEYQSRCRDNANCIVCDFKGLNIRNLSCHMIFKHREEKETWCSRCNKLFDNIEEHRKTHTNKEWCRFCKKNISKCHYMEHLKGHAGLGYSCGECQKKFISEKTLEEHVARHKQEKPFKCPLCPKVFKLVKSLEDHVSLHGRYKCQECEKNFEIPELLASHLCSGKTSKKNVFPEDSVKIKEAEIYEDLNDGEAQVKEDEENNVEYTENYALTKSNAKLKRIIEELTCNFCQRSYKTAYKLQKHIEGHMGIFSVKCTYCDKGFSSKADLANHERVHTKEKPFICNYCGKGFCSAATLRTHMIQHTGKPEECELCQKRFCRKSELKLHMQKHRGERPFLCTDCGKSFAQKSHLTCHVTMHSEERPYACSMCDKAFKKKELLKHHVKLHGEKKFKCTVCLYECHKNYRLQQHMKMHENRSDTKPHICHLCSKAFSSLAMVNKHLNTCYMIEGKYEGK